MIPDFPASRATESFEFIPPVPDFDLPEHRLLIEVSVSSEASIF